MFQDLRRHKVILVTGPHRSGTTICAKMIAQDTGHDLVVEDDFGYSNKLQLSAFVHSDYSPMVIQCPFMAHIVHDLEYEIGLNMGEALVVFMRRDRSDIMDSERRARMPQGGNVNFEKIGWAETCKYRPDKPKHISDLKYDAWGYQKAVIPNWMEVEYESLRDHSLWIESRDFNVRQTHPDQTVPDIEVRPPPKVFEDALKRIWH